MLSDEKLKEIEARAAAATPGPWAVGASYRADWDVVSKAPGHVDWRVAQAGHAGPGGMCDPAFIAAARTDVPELVAEVRKLRSALTELVDLKELKERNIGGPNYLWMSEYSRRKPLAWAAAREALGKEG